MSNTIHIHIGTKDADTWLDKDIQALTAAIQAVGMASPVIRSKLKPIMMEQLEILKKMKASGGGGR